MVHIYIGGQISHARSTGMRKKAYFFKYCSDMFTTYVKCVMYGQKKVHHTVQGMFVHTEARMS